MSSPISQCASKYLSKKNLSSDKTNDLETYRHNIWRNLGNELNEYWRISWPPRGHDGCRFWIQFVLLSAVQPSAVKLLTSPKFRVIYPRHAHELWIQIHPENHRLKNRIQIFKTPSVTFRLNNRYKNYLGTRPKINWNHKPHAQTSFKIGSQN